jgi:hypothetical protein
VTRHFLAVVLLCPAAAAAFTFPTTAPAADVATIADEIESPGVYPPVGAAPTPLRRLPYAAAALKHYAADVPLAEVRKAANAEKYAFRQGVLAVLDEIREKWANEGRQFRPSLPAEISPATKADLVREQDELAVRIVTLEVAMAKLNALEPLRAREPKRWQANFDLARAELPARLAAMHQYNLILGQARQEDLPVLDPARHTGYRLRTSEKAIRKFDIRVLWREAAERYEAITKDHPGTPWAVAARRALAAPQGLAWEPVGKE